MQVNINPNEDSEFHDALRARGIIPPKAPSRLPSPELPTSSESRSEALKHATVQDIDNYLEADKAGEEEERILIRLRRQRMAQLAHEIKSHQFGRVYPINRPDYTREVTEASKLNLQGDDDEEEKKEKRKKGTGVVCFLYKDGLDECRLIAGYLDTLAAKYPATKFVSIVGDKCIPDYPDKNLPTLLIYRAGELHRQIVGLRPEIGLDGINTKCEDIELLLSAVGALNRSSVPGSANYSGPLNPTKEEDAGQDSDKGFGGTRGEQGKSIRSKKPESDDDLDWDM